MDDLIKQGANAFRAGNRDEARKLLLTAVKQSPDSERAWGWLYNVTDNDKERIYCLNQMLRINPNNEKANRLLNSLTSPQFPFENQQPQVSKQSSQKVQIPAQAIKKQPVSKSSNTKSRRTPLILIGVIGLITLCICGFFFIVQFRSSIGGEQTTAKILTAEDVFEVSAVDLMKTDGYTITSAVCEVISPEQFQPLVNSGRGQIVFHAFRVTGSNLKSEVVVLFYSNHTAANGNGWIHPVNAEAINLYPDIDAGSVLSYPITINTAGAQVALDCARQAGKPPTLKLGNFDIEAWRRKAIEKFGPEQTYTDGSKDDHVETALSICKQSNDERATMLANLGTDYEGSFQQFAIETFCPYIGDN